jgi:hypothetical protein
VSETRVFLMAVFALGGLFFGGSANAQRVYMGPSQHLYDPAEKGRNAIADVRALLIPMPAARNVTTRLGMVADTVNAFGATRSRPRRQC